MTVADVMNIVAVEIHVTPASQILEPDALGLADRRETWGRDGLAEEVARVFLQHRIDRGVTMARRPLDTAARSIDVALRLRRGAIPA